MHQWLPLRIVSEGKRRCARHVCKICANWLSMLTMMFCLNHGVNVAHDLPPPGYFAVSIFRGLHTTCFPCGQTSEVYHLHNLFDPFCPYLWWHDDQMSTSCRAANMFRLGVYLSGIPFRWLVGWLSLVQVTLASHQAFKMLQDCRTITFFQFYFVSCMAYDLVTQPLLMHS